MEKAMAFECITVEPDTFEGKPCARGLRITVEAMVTRSGEACHVARGHPRTRLIRPDANERTVSATTKDATTEDATT
jgi:hypothetical protein